MLSVNLASSEISGKEVARINIPQNPHITIPLGTLLSRLGSLAPSRTLLSLSTQELGQWADQELS